MLFFAKNKLASLDKKITVYLANSKWYGNNCSRTFADGLDPIDQNEEWVSLVIEFIEFSLSQNKKKTCKMFVLPLLGSRRVLELKVLFYFCQ